MSFTTILFLYAILIVTALNVYEAMLASLRNISNAVESEALQSITTAAAQNDQIKHVKQRIHENTLLGSTIQTILDWIDANKLAPLQFDIVQDFNCHRALAKNVIDQLLTSPRLLALFQNMNSETNVPLAKAIAKLALVAMDLGESTAILAAVTEALLICNDCSALNFIHFSVNQNASIEKLHHIQQRMEFETLFVAASNCRGTDNAFRDQHQHSGHSSTNDSTERIAVSALERISRLQAAVGFIVPTSMHDIASEKAGRRISNSSALSNSSGISSSICPSPSISSAGTSNTSLTSYNLSKKECSESNVSMNMLQPNEATYYDIIKFKIDLSHIKWEAHHLLNQVIIPLSSSTFSTKNFNRIKQLQHAFVALMSTCCHTELALNDLQYGFAFDQLATHVASHLIEGAYSKLHQQASIKNYQESDFKELTTRVNKALDVASFVLRAFSIPTAVSSSYHAKHLASIKALTNKCIQLGSAYKVIDSIYNGFIEIKRTVQEGQEKLNSLHYDQTVSLQNSSTHTTAVQSVFAIIYICSTQKLQPLYETLKQRINVDNTSAYQSHEKIVINMVSRLFEDIDNIKAEIKRVFRDLRHLTDTHNVKADIDQAKGWLQAMNYSLGLFIALEALVSVDSIDADQEALQDKYSNFQEKFSEFTLTTYNKICSYFTEDYDAGLNYQKLGDTHAGNHSKEAEYALFDSLQQVVDQTSKLLNYAHQILVQRKAATEYLHYAHLIQQSVASHKPIPASTSYQHVFACFSNIQYPQLNIDGLYNMFYYYQQDLFLSLSRTKVNLINSRLVD